MRVATLSIHSSPLAQPGLGDGGGLNVYVDALARALRKAGVSCDVFTRADRPGLPPVVEIERGYRVVHLDVGPPEPISKHETAALTPELTDAFIARGCAHGYDLLHANYWLSGAVAHALKHDLGMPMAATFHTLDRVKAEVGIDDDVDTRAATEREVIQCADLMLTSTDEEVRQLVELYDADPTRVEVLTPGVDREVFHPVEAELRARYRAELGIEGRMLLFVGRVQPLKGVDLAVSSLAFLDRDDTTLVIVGGASGRDGEAELHRVRALAHDLGIADRVRFVAPQPHRTLARYYQAADVSLVPSRSESFGLVALEAAACGTPVVASDVGGLSVIVRDGQTGFLVDTRRADAFAAPIAALLEDESRRCAMSVAASERAKDFTWSVTAARFRRLAADLVAGDPQLCR